MRVMALGLCFMWIGGCVGGEGAATSDYNPPFPPLGTITGAVEMGTAPPPTGDVHMALVWSGHTSGNAKIGQDIRIQTEVDGIASPVKFRLDITSPPPSESLEQQQVPRLPNRGSGIDEARMAAGQLVVYEDGNGNGKLDFIPDGASSSPDRLLGVDEAHDIRYLEGTQDDIDYANERWSTGTATGVVRYVDGQGYVAVPRFDGPPLERGFNLMEVPIFPSPERCVASPCESSAFPDVSGERIHFGTRISFSTHITIRLGVSESAKQAQCLDWWRYPLDAIFAELFDPDPAMQAWPPCPDSQVPTGAGTICRSPDRYLAGAIDPEAPLCSESRFTYCSVKRDPSTPTPSGWPCPETR